MCIDLGGTTDTVSEMTGLSKKTVKERQKLLPIVQSDALQKAYNDGAQITFSDMEKLLKLKDEKVRAEVLESIGKSSFESNYTAAINEQNRIERMNKIYDALLAAGAVEVESREGYLYETWVDNAQKVEEKKKYFDSKGWTMYFTRSGYSYVDLYRDKAEEPATTNNQEITAEAAEARRKEEEFTERKQKLADLAARCYERRYNFIKAFDPEGKAMQALRFAAKIATVYDGYGLSYATLAELLGVKLPEGYTDIDSWDYDRVFAPFDTADDTNIDWMMYVLVAASYLQTSDGKYNSYHKTYNGQYDDENYELNFLYDELCTLGYEMSDEEKAYKTGTHELFVNNEE